MTMTMTMAHSRFCQRSTRTSVASLLLLLLIICTSFFDSAHAETTNQEQSSSAMRPDAWQGCDVFLAPAGTMGWGVFAARSFKEGEIVEIAPLYVTSTGGSAVTKHTVLDDYVYGMMRGETYHSAIIFGMAMYYNHHPQPNVVYSSIPSIDNEEVKLINFYARRDINAGEQLFSSYGDDYEGMQAWFKNRGMEMQAPVDSKISSQHLPLLTREYCSRIHATVGQTSHFIQNASEHYSKLETNAAYSAPMSAGLGAGKAKIDFPQAGQRIELSTALVMSKKMIDGTLLGALAIRWEDLDVESQQQLIILRETGRLNLQYQSDETKWQRMDRFTTMEDIALLPTGGNLVSVQRVFNRELLERNGGEDTVSNCRLFIHSQGAQPGSVGVTLELISTRPIQTGEVLRVNLPPAGTLQERQLLEEELEFTGQWYYAKETGGKDEL